MSVSGRIACCQPVSHIAVHPILAQDLASVYSGTSLSRVGHSMDNRGLLLVGGKCTRSIDLLLRGTIRSVSIGKVQRGAVFWHWRDLFEKVQKHRRSFGCIGAVTDYAVGAYAGSLWVVLPPLAS